MMLSKILEVLTGKTNREYLKSNLTFFISVRKMSFLWSVDKSNLPKEDNKSDKSAEKCEKEQKSSSAESENVTEKTENIEKSSKIKRKIPLDDDEDEFLTSKFAKEEEVEEQEDNKSEKNTDNCEKSTKRTLDSPETPPFDVKKSRNNEILSSLSSYSDEIETLDEKSVEISNIEPVQEEEIEQQQPSRKRKALIFPKNLSPKKMIKDLPKVNSTDEEKCEEISDLKAFNADQEKSVERGQNLMKAFEDD